MATMLESAVLPRSITTSFTPSSPVNTKMGSSSFCALPSTRQVRSLPQFNGLKIQLGSSRRRLVTGKSKNGEAVRHGGSIVCETQEAAVLVPEVADGTWKSLVIESDLPVLVEFWAPWCGPCRMIHPVIDELAQEFAGKLRCFKMNTDESPTIASEYGIRSIPTVMLFKKGEKKDAVVGAVPKTTLITCIEKFL